MAIIRIPALIDPHFHMVEANQQTWRQIAQIAKAAGYWAIQVMPDLDPPITDKLALAHYTKQASGTHIPLFLTAAGTAQNTEELKQLRNISAVKVWLGTGPEDLVVTKEEELRQILLSTDKVVMIHAEDENTLLRNYNDESGELTLERHPQIFDRKAAIRATVKAITAAKETKRRIYISHISTAEEIELVREAKSKGIRVYAEVAPHHLFLNEHDIDRLQNRSKVNPPLRSEDDQRALWRAINDGTIDTIGSDNYSWLAAEKEQPYDEVPSGLPNFEMLLPLILTAVHDKRLNLARAISLTSTNAARIFGLPKPTRSLFVDIDTPRPVRPKLSDWHPYNYDRLVGWPIRQKDESKTIII